MAELHASEGPELGILDLADQAEVSADWLHCLDRGKLGSVDLENLDRLCRILGRSPNDLLGYEADS